MWYWIHVYNGDHCIGSTYGRQNNREYIKNILNKEFGAGDWENHITSLVQILEDAIEAN